MCLSVRLHDWIYRNRNVVGRHTTQVFHTCETRTSYDKSTNRATEKNTIFQNVYSIKAAWRLVFGETPISQLIQANMNSKGSFTFLRTERGAASLLFVFNLSINMWISIICSINKGIYTFNSHIFFGESTATTNNNKTIRTAIKVNKKNNPLVYGNTNAIRHKWYCWKRMPCFWILFSFGWDETVGISKMSSWR